MVAVSRAPMRLTSRALSTTRNWSSAIWPSLPEIVQATRKGAANPPCVSGAMITVCSRAFIASRDTTTHGRVFRISAPAAGSSWTHQMSNLFIWSGLRPLPPAGIPFVRHLPKGPQFLKVAVNGFLRDLPNGLVPADTRRSPRRHDQGLVPYRHVHFLAEATGVYQRFWAAEP